MTSVDGRLAADAWVSLSVQVTELYIDEWSSSDPKVQAGFELFLTAADHAGIDLLVYVGEDAGPGVAADVASVGRWCANATGRCGPRPTTLKTKTDDDDDNDDSAQDTEGTGPSATQNDGDDDESAEGTGPSAVAQVEEELESVIQEALVMYEKMDKLDVMGGEPGLRQRKPKPAPLLRDTFSASARL